MIVKNLQNLINECIMLEDSNYLGGNFSTSLLDCQKDLDKGELFLKEHLEEKLEEWRELFEEAKELKAHLHKIHKCKASFFAYKEMLDFMKQKK